MICDHKEATWSYYQLLLLSLSGTTNGRKNTFTARTTFTLSCKTSVFYKKNVNANK